GRLGGFGGGRGRRGFCGFDLEDRRADGYGLPFLHQDLGDLPRRRAGDRDGRLVGLDLEQVLLDGDGVSLRHEDRKDVARLDVLAEAGEGDFRWHGDYCCYGWNRESTRIIANRVN